MTPAAPKRPRSAFWEILVQGNPERCYGLLTGLVLGAASGAKLVFGEHAGIRTPLGERILDRMNPHAGVTHVIVDSEGRRLLRSFAKKLEGLGFRIAGEKRVKSARFEYGFHAYAKRYGDEIRALLAALPRSLKHEPGRTKETQDSRARGLEAYSPVHDYEIKGGGKISGPVDAVLEARAALGAHPLVKAGDVELETE